MFDLFAMLLSSITSFLFPIFASYKALKTSDPAQLTPWLMYWVVFSCCILIESWVSFVLFWVPFYGYIRLLFLLYLILPQTQGARIIYEEHIHPFLEQNEGQIDDFIASAHDRLKAAGMAYFRQAIEYLKTNILGQPPSDPAPPTPEQSGPQSYTQSLLARFSVPSARWAAAANPSSDFQNLLASAVSALSTAGGLAGAGAGANIPSSGRLIPSHLQSPVDKMSFIAAQRDRLNILLRALDREAQELQHSEEHASHHRRAPSMAFDGHDDDEPTQRPPSGQSGWSGLSKSRSEVDFEKIDAESGAEDNDALRRRNVTSGSTPGGGSWMPWGWGGGGTPDAGRSTGMDQ
ncbi:hypothetical protein S40293_06927 [Stachybotrys chartarum IBT 40293]|nr:hypothetical protein S40293_06927 [Stachybotrys chartarum IBT 40293]